MIFNYEPEITEEDIISVVNCINTGIANPAHVLNAELEILKKFNCNTILTSSGTSALHISLISLGIGPGDEVICPSFTFAATWNAIEYVGATPIFVDSNRDTWCISISEIENKINKNTKAIISVDIFGNPCDYKSIMEISKRFNIPVIGDCAESLGAVYMDNPVIKYPDIACTSFNLNKIATSCGGGAIFSSNKDIENTLRRLLNQNKKHNDYDYYGVGFNYRMGSINAALLTPQIKRIEDTIKTKKETHERYVKALSEFSEISFQKNTPGSIPNKWVTVLRFSKKNTRDRVYNMLSTENIESKIPFKPGNLVKWISEKYNLNDLDFKESKKIYERCLILPSSTGIRDQDIDRVVLAIRNCLIAQF